MASDSATDFLLAIPCLNERKRLPPFLKQLVPALGDSALTIRIQVVDDGSREEEFQAVAQAVERLQPEFPSLLDPLRLERNRGKSAAIRAAWDTAENCRYLAFVDADGAISADETRRFLESIPLERDALAIATRRQRNVRDPDRPFHRALPSRSLNYLLRKRLGIRVYDTQCGLKAVPRKFYRDHRDRFRDPDYGLDLELILTANKHELPLIENRVEWREIAGSRMRLGTGLRFAGRALLGRI